MLTNTNEIKKYLDNLDTVEEKLDFLLYQNKELKKVIYAFENTVLKKYKEENNNLEFHKASELAEFIRDLEEVKETENCKELDSIVDGMREDLGEYFKKTEYYKKYYDIDVFNLEVSDENVDDEIMCGIMDINAEIEKKLKVFRICDKYINTEIEYYEKIAGKKENKLNHKEINNIKFETYNFDYRKIRVEIDELPTQGKKKAYLLFLQKELKRVIRCYESDRFTPWKVKGENCSERNRFIEERYDVYNRVYNREEHNIDQYVEADVSKKTEELKDLAKAIDDEIDFVNAMSTIREERNMDDFKILWEELTEGNFDLKVLLRQFEQIGEDREDEYIEYCVRRFRHRTIDEWMRYYSTKNLTENIEALKKARLPEELEYKNTIRITNAKFEDSTLGQWTRDNLESFESKYITKDYISTLQIKIKKLRIEINNLIKKRLPIKAEIEKLNDRIKILEIKFDNDIDDFEMNLKQELSDCKVKITEYEEAINKIDMQLWGLVSNKEGGLIWKHDNLVRDFKLESIGDKELFKELDYKSSDRWTKHLKDRISKILTDNRKKIGEDEMDDLVLEVLKQHQADDEEIFDEIINPELAEPHLDIAIKNVLYKKRYIKDTLEDSIEITEKVEQTNETQRDKIKKYLIDNYPNFKSNPIDNISVIAEEIVTQVYPVLSGAKKKNKVKSIRVELTNIRSGRIPFDE